jgi:predicted PolB exonuclease-like 3'-5' exonuclease
MKHERLMVFDIETVPDLKAAKNLLGNQVDLKEGLVNYHLDLTKGLNSFIRQPFHRVVSIAFLEADIRYENGYEYYCIKELRSGGNLESTESELVSGFFNYMKQQLPRLVSFNGRTFDLPVLKYRAMLHGVPAKWFYDSGDKWNGYNNRYSLDWHCDLLEAFSDFGTSARVKMSEVSAMFGIPSKLDCDGAVVDLMYEDGKIEEIRDYCELDVVNTYLLYLRYAMHRGQINKDGYADAVDDLINFMKGKEKPHYERYLNEYNKIQQWNYSNAD